MKLYGFGPMRSLRALWGLKELNTENFKLAHARPSCPVAIAHSFRLPRQFCSGRRISGSSSLLDGCDEPEILPCSTAPVRLTGSDGELDLMIAGPEGGPSSDMQRYDG